MEGIVIGMDESQSAAAALRWAVREARLRDCPATALLAWGFLDQHHATPGRPFDPDYNEDKARAALGAMVEAAVGTEDADSVELEVACDLPARALLEASADADLLVVGARGLGGFRTMLLGSVSSQVLHHLVCPTAVTRTSDTAPTDGERVVVGVDGSPAGQGALSWALEEARARGATLELVHAWQPAFVGGDVLLPVATEGEAMVDAANALLERALGAEDTTGVEIATTIAAGSAASAVLGSAERASLVVVGSRGTGGFAGLRLGSTSQNVSRHAPCPVVVVPPAT